MTGFQNVVIRGLDFGATLLPAGILLAYAAAFFGLAVWRFRTEHQVSSSPAVYRDAVYCGSVDGVLYCLEYRTGRLRWRFETGAAIIGSAVVFDDIVYVGATNHRVYALLA